MTRLKHKRMKRFKVKDNIINIILKVIPILLIVWFIWAQYGLLINKNFIYSTSDLPKSFTGYKIVHISDICNTSINIESKVKKQNPDIIVVSGGYSDKNGDYSKSVKIVNKLTQIAPVYYIYNSEDTIDILASTNATNITDMTVQLSPKQQDVKTFIENNYGKAIIDKYNKGDSEAVDYINYVTEELSNTSNSTIDLCGLGLYNYDNGIYDAKNKTYELIGTDATRLSILLNGNINNLDEICKTDVDVIMFGGTFGTELISLDYTKGLYGNHGTSLFVSGGVGNHLGITRLLNFPEIQTITLSDGTITDKNPLEDFIGIFLKDVGTIFDNDGGFSSYKRSYENGEIKN